MKVSVAWPVMISMVRRPELRVGIAGCIECHTKGVLEKPVRPGEPVLHNDLISEQSQ